ncbi:zinc finger protein 714-like [Malaya genurostris]|uniref:zinc finger protein 714-like n=1 Tax=Malaya genurostris TaxID=325434 RepID=UPI0026F3D606|nr:zinc finger protein 714-like [Malaya genurostris]
MDKSKEICRFCLKSSGISGSTSVNDADFRLKCMVVFHFIITEDELLPAIVCSSCRSKVIEFYDYHETVRVNQIHLTSETIGDKEDKNERLEDVNIKQEFPNFENNELNSVVWIGEREIDYDAEDVKQESSETVLEFKVELNDSDTSTSCKKADTQIRRSVKLKTSKRIDEHKQNRKSKSQEERVKRYDDENRKISEFFKMTCEYCPEIAETFGRLQTHCRNVHNQKAGVKCCDRIFYVKSRIIEHINSHQNPKRFHCEICQKYYHSKEYLALHNLKKHSKIEDKPFNCDKCDKSFSKAGLLNAHMKAHIQIKCTVCHRMLASKSLKMHMLRHTGNMKYVCDTCGKEFRSKITLEQHIKRHMGIDDRLQCHICSRWILGKRYLKVHMKTVHCDKNQEIACNICFLKYPNERSLSVHKGRVHVEKKFECEFCGKKFKRSINCKEHRASHTGEVLYTCNVCGMTCNSNGNLYSHKKNKHPEEWMEAKKKAFAATYGQKIGDHP